MSNEWKDGDRTFSGTIKGDSQVTVSNVGDFPGGNLAPRLPQSGRIIEHPDGPKYRVIGCSHTPGENTAQLNVEPVDPPKKAKAKEVAADNE